MRDILTLAKEVYDYFFDFKIKLFLQKYPAELTVNNESFWSGYRRAPTRMPFDANNEDIFQCVSVLAKVLAKMFNVEVGEIEVT